MHGGGIRLKAPLPPELLDLEVVLQREDVILYRLQTHNLGELLLDGSHSGLSGSGGVLLPHLHGEPRLGVLRPKGIPFREKPSLHRPQGLVELLLAEGPVEPVRPLLQSIGPLVRGEAVRQGPHLRLSEGELHLQLLFTALLQAGQLPPGDLL